MDMDEKVTDGWMSGWIARPIHFLVNGYPGVTS